MLRIDRVDLAKSGDSSASLGPVQINRVYGCHSLALYAGSVFKIQPRSC
jgi:hypothetical protein